MVSSAAAPPSSRLSAFRHRDFRLLMFATVMTNLVMPMQFISLTFWAVDTYPDQKVVLSSAIVAARGAGMLCFSFIGGAIADRFERRRVLLACEAASFAVTALMAITMITKPCGDATIVAVLALVFMAASNMAIDGPSRSASIPVIVSKAEIGPAIALNNVAAQLTFPAILPLVGFLTGSIGPAEVIAVSLLAWVAILPLVAALRYSSKAAVLGRTSHGMVADIRAGISYTVRDVTILAVLSLVVTLQVVGMPGVGMLGPVWMTEVLGLSRAQFGFLAMLWGLGALVASVVFAVYNGSTRRGTTLIVLVAVFGIGAIAFGHSRVVAITAVANFALGFAMAGTLVTAMTIVQYAVAEEMRGRVMGLFPLIMGASMVNVLVVGGAAEASSLEVVVPTLGWMALGLVGVVAVVAPGLRRLRPAVITGPAPAAAPAAGGGGT